MVHNDFARDVMERDYIAEIEVSTVLQKWAFITPQQVHYSRNKIPELVIRILQLLVPLMILGLALLSEITAR